METEIKYCLQCGAELPKRKTFYCNGECKELYRANHPSPVGVQKMTEKMHKGRAEQIKADKEEDAEADALRSSLLANFVIESNDFDGEHCIYCGVKLGHSNKKQVCRKCFKLWNKYHRKCPVCGQFFFTDGTYQRICPKCKETLYHRVCIYCGKHFVPNKKENRCPECAERLSHKICAMCGKSFIDYGQRRYCTSCRQPQHKEYNNAKPENEIRSRNKPQFTLDDFGKAYKKAKKKGIELKYAVWTQNPAIWK